MLNSISSSRIAQLANINEVCFFYFILKSEFYNHSSNKYKIFNLVFLYRQIDHPPSICVASAIFRMKRALSVGARRRRSQLLGVFLGVVGMLLTTSEHDAGWQLAALTEHAPRWQVKPSWPDTIQCPLMSSFRYVTF